MSVSAPSVVSRTSQDLVRFLLARVDDDGSEIKRLAKREHGEEGGSGVRSIERMQADTAVKRRLIGGLQQLLVLRDQPFEKAIRDQATEMLRVLATPYDKHTGYRREWRPSGSH
jgi:hypothetical protein